MDARRARDKRDGLRYATHVDGRCGDLNTICLECYDDELEEMLTWARQQPDPVPGENVSQYWQRIGGRYLDTWHDAATTRMLEADGACDSCGIVVLDADFCTNCGEDLR